MAYYKSRSRLAITFLGESKATFKNPFFLAAIFCGAVGAYFSVAANSSLVRLTKLEVFGDKHREFSRELLEEIAKAINEETARKRSIASGLQFDHKFPGLVDETTAIIMNYKGELVTPKDGGSLTINVMPSRWQLPAALRRCTMYDVYVARTGSTLPSIKVSSYEYC